MDSIKPSELIQVLDIFLKHTQESPLLVLIAGFIVFTITKYLYDKVFGNDAKKAIDASVNEVNKTILDNTKDLAERYHKLSLELIEHTETILALKNTIHEMESNIHDLEGKVKKLEEEKAQHVSEINNLKEQIVP